MHGFYKVQIDIENMANRTDGIGGANLRCLVFSCVQSGNILVMGREKE
jgi:hypothetical protein